MRLVNNKYTLTRRYSWIW